MPSPTGDGLLQLITATSPDVIVVLDPAGAITFVSPAVERLLGWAPAALACLRLPALAHEDDRPGLEEVLGAVRLGVPGVLQFHVGRMVKSHRPVVEQSYAVALNLVFSSKQAQDEYQIHPRHVDFVEKVFKKVCTRVVVYDFE